MVCKLRAETSSMDGIFLIVNEYIFKQKTLQNSWQISWGLGKVGEKFLKYQMIVLH